MAPFSANATPHAQPNERHAEVASTVQYEDPFEKENARFQIAWNTVMDKSGHYKTPSFYKKVSCLLVSWDKACDDLHTDEEVSKLAGVLEKTFHYKVIRVYLDSNSDHLPHIQLMKYTSDFLYAEDAYQTLLLVYYAGHGSPKSSGNGRHGLTLSGKRKLSENPGEVNEIVWGRIEDNFQDTKADVLEVFDCCYAGDLGSTRQTWSYRSFEFLGACSSGNTTLSPGQGSFTTALIWALEALVEEQSKFLVSVQLDRCSRSLERIILAPLLESSDQGDSTFVNSHVSGPQGLLNLNFIFNEVPTMDLIKQFGWSLNRFVWQSEMPVSRIAWGGLTSWEGVQPSSGANAIKMDAIKAFKEAGMRRRSSRMKHTPGQIVLPGNAAPQQGADLLSPSPTPSQTSQAPAQKRRQSHG